MVNLPAISLVIFGLQIASGPSSVNTDDLKRQMQECYAQEMDRLVSDPEKVAFLRTWTEWESVRWLYSMTGDAESCGPISVKLKEQLKRLNPKSGEWLEEVNKPYERAKNIVFDRHLYRDTNAPNN